MTIFISLWTNIAIAGLNDYLFEAADQGDINALKSIIDGGADVNAKANDGRTVLMVASMGGHLEIVRALISNGAYVNAKTNDGRTALIDASMGDHLEIVRVLIGKGAYVNAKTNDGRTALIDASMGGHLEIVRVLIGKGAYVNAKTNDGRTALMIASMGGHLEIVRELIADGADVDAKTNVTALSLAMINDHQRVVELLEKAGTQVKGIPPAAKPVEVALQPTAMPVIPSVAEPVARPAAAAQPIVSELAQSNASPSTPQAPTAEAQKLEQKRIFYTLLAGETVSRSKLDILLSKLKITGLQPVVREEHKTTDVYRLVTECFSEGTAAKKHLTNLARQKRDAFIMHDAKLFCVVVASLFSYDAALTGQNMLAKQALRTEIVKVQIPLITWQVTVGRYNEKHSAEVELKRLTEQGINVVLTSWE